mmetsp:Transcript_8312/g.16666  ORF Transcript_8312/g.16666 Transcript_8312/m.16666 type:complete len:291 (-) Transcript_8312:733-1605(-)
MGIGFFRRKGKRLETCQTAGQQLGDGPRGGKRRGKGRNGGSSIDNGLIRAVGMDRCAAGGRHSQNMGKVFVAPWSYSRKEIQEKMDKYRAENSRIHSRQIVPGELMLGDTEGLWGTRFHMDDVEVRKEHQRKLGLSEREEARLERILYTQNDESSLIRVLGRSRHRCRKSMGAERWKEFMNRENKSLKEHVSMLENKWGRRFVDSCRRFIADTPLVKRRESEPLQRAHVDVIHPPIESPHTSRLEMKTNEDSHVIGSLREKYDLNIGKVVSTVVQNDDSFRILARPTSAA